MRRGRKPKIPAKILETHIPDCPFNASDQLELSLKGMRMLHWSHGVSKNMTNTSPTFMCLIFGCPNPRCSAEAAIPFEYITAQLKLKHIAECLKVTEE